MTLKELRAKATAAELCLIEATLRASSEDDVERFLVILRTHIMRVSALWQDRHIAQELRDALNRSILEYRKATPETPCSQ